MSKASSLIESVFNRLVVGLRPGGGFHSGFKGCIEVFGILWKNGIRFVSSQLRGPSDTIPGPLTQPYWYEEEGYQGLLEMPGHDWHDCVLIPYVKPFLTLWPPIVPGGLPSQPPTTPKGLFQVYRPSFDYAVQNNLLYYSPVFHPWSIYRFDRKARIVNILLRYAKKQGMETKSYYAVYPELKTKNS